MTNANFRRTANYLGRSVVTSTEGDRARPVMQQRKYGTTDQDTYKTYKDVPYQIEMNIVDTNPSNDSSRMPYI